MNKYFLPVYHSELKPWIKWWILKRLNGGESTLKAVTISSGTLTKVDKSKALSIKEYYGNTVQNGTPSPESPVEIQTISGDNTFTINDVNYRLDFGGIELCKIGDYKDKIVNDNGTWKVEKNIGKVVLNENSTNWTPSIVATGVSRFAKVFSDISIYSDSSRHTGKFIVNRFIPNTNNAVGNAYQYQNQLLFCISSDDATTGDEFKAWLSTHNIIVYYILATPTTETITNENLIQQLNALYEFYVGMSTVTISNNSEIPLEVLLEYYGR